MKANKLLGVCVAILISVSLEAQEINSIKQTYTALKAYVFATENEIDRINPESGSSQATKEQSLTTLNTYFVNLYMPILRTQVSVSCLKDKFADNEEDRFDQELDQMHSAFGKTAEAYLNIFRGIKQYRAGEVSDTLRWFTSLKNLSIQFESAVNYASPAFDSSSVIAALEEEIDERNRENYRANITTIARLDECGRKKDNLVDQSKTEAFTNYHENGEVKETGYMSEGKKIGNYTSFYESGQLQSEGVYKNNSPWGNWKEYYENGTLESHTVYDDDNQSHYRKKFYDTEGRFSYMKMYDGSWSSMMDDIRYDEEGKVLEKE